MIMNFPSKIDNTVETYKFTDEEKAAVKKGETLLFIFDIRADVSTPIKITVDVGTVINDEDGSMTMEYFAPVQFSRIYMPVTNNGMVSVSVETEGVVYLQNAGYTNQGNTPLSDLQLKSGMWLLDAPEQTSVDSSYGIGVGKTIDLIKKGNFIYSIGNGAFTVTDAEQKKILGKIEGFGTLRQMDITDDGKLAVLTGRQDGVYIINIEDPESPKIISTYNAIEQATGIHVSGNYAFVCNRQYGVEVVDISDPSKPMHLANIHSGEVQSCTVYNNILYAGVWAQCGIYMYDLSKLNDSPDLKPIATVTTDGKGDGMTVTEIDGRIYLFAATGQHTYSASTSSSLQNLAYGQGNGMDIFDVTDPDNIKWISSSKIDGRYYYTSNDYWETEVAYDKTTGKYYAYLVNTYNGIYVYDVTDPRAPIREAKIVLSAPLTSTVPALTHATRAIITSWDQSKENRVPVGAISIDNGVMYIAGASNDLYVLDTEAAKSHYSSVSTDTEINVSDSFYEFKNEIAEGSIDSLDKNGYAFAKLESQALGAAVYGDLLYVASGADGILILKKDTLEKIGQIPPVSVGERIGFATDVKICGNTLYAACDVAGLRVYDLSDSKASSPQYLWSYTVKNNIVRQVTISQDERFAAVQIGNNIFRIVDCSTHKEASFLIEESNKKVTSITTSGGNIYHHQMSTLMDGRYVGIWNHISSEYWIDFGPTNAPYDVPRVVSKGGTYKGSFNGSLGMYNGATEYVKNGTAYALKIQSKACYITTTYTKKSVTKLFSVEFNGKPTVCGEYLIICDRVNGKIAIYEISTGAHIGTLTVSGNPDIAYADGDTVYIPLGYQGILAIDTSKAF